MKCTEDLIDLIKTIVELMSAILGLIILVETKKSSAKKPNSNKKKRKK